MSSELDDLLAGIAQEGDGQYMTNLPRGEMINQAQILALRQMSDSLNQLTNRLDKQQNKHDQVVELIGAIRTDIAVMKAQQEELEDLRECTRDHETRIVILELRNAQQDGAAIFVKWVKDFGPWLFGLLALAISLFGKPHAP